MDPEIPRVNGPEVFGPFRNDPRETGLAAAGPALGRCGQPNPVVSSQVMSNLTGHLSVILVEDNVRDAELIGAALAAEGLACDLVRVDQAETFRTALERGGVDLILSDYQLPRFDGLSALKLAQTKWSAIPFIFVSGALGEELAIETLKLGATDYVLKHRLSKLAPAVRRAMGEVKERAVRKTAESRLLQAEKMEVVGRLTASVAHDFNNLLTVVNGYSEIALRHLPDEHPSHRAIETIKSAGKRGTALIQRLLAFSRQPVHQPRVVEVNAILGDLQHLLESLLGSEIRLVMTLNGETGCIEVDPSDIEQTIMNLAANARDAMPLGGELSIVTEAARFDEADASAIGLSPGDYSILVLSDTGEGMDEATRARVFEPFFTTKAVGKGSGLGLWSVKEAVARYQGAILVDSAPGHGATFRLYLPRVASQPDKARAPVAAVQAEGPDTILVVDDVDEIRSMMQQVLEEEGYRVLTARSGPDALEIAANELQNIGLVLADVRMPGMGGPEMVAKLRVLQPQIKVVFISGYSGQKVFGEPLLSKPFTPDGLLKTVQTLLPAR